MDIVKQLKLGLSKLKVGNCNYGVFSLGVVPLQKHFKAVHKPHYSELIRQYLFTNLS